MTGPAAAVVLAGGAAWAGERTDAEPVAPGVGVVREAVATRAEIRPTLNGEVLDDPAWADASVISGFWQTTPSEGAPASEHTEVRVLYTEDTLYIGVVNYDREPDRIVTTDARRDGSLNETDSFLVILDTYLDRQNGFVFGTNPAGAEYDGQVTNEGQGGGFNLNWDGEWEVQTRISEIGWSAEFAIPFRTLRYPSRAAQAWGINFQRNIRRLNETSFWAPLSRQYNLHRLSLAGQLRGLEVPPPRNLQLMPFVLSQARQRGTEAAGTTTIGDVGGDVKYSITPSLTLDVTVNTDFAQVEVDDQQINLDRFSLFFPEKRPFFLENAGLFSVGLSREAEVFFTRRIGIGPGGRPIPITGGGRLTGRVGRGVDVGLLNIQTGAVPGLGVPSNNFSVARVRQELPNRSAAGIMFVNRQGTGPFAGDRDYNRSYAADGRVGIGPNGLVSGFVAATQTPGLSGENHAYELGSDFSFRRVRLRNSYAHVGDNFNPEVGFLSRGGFRRVEARVNTFFRPAGFWRFHELRPHVTYIGYWNHEGFYESGHLHMDQHWEFRNGYQFDTGVNVTREGVTRPFEIFPGVIVPPGGYDHVELQPDFRTNQGAPVSLRIRARIGGFFGGSRRLVQPTLRARVGNAFDTRLSVSRNDIDLPGGKFSTNLWNARVSYSFTSRIFVQSLIQYNDRASLWSSNVRFGWLREANTGLFVVYNDTQGLASTDLLRPERSLTIKFSRLVNLFN